MNIHAMNPKKISQECSERHVQSVIEGLMERLMEAEALADEVLTLNTKVLRLVMENFIRKPVNLNQ